MNTPTTAKFNYPKEFKTIPEYNDHSGQTVVVVRQLTRAEADQEDEKMYLIRASDGWEGHAWESELELP